MRGDHKEAKLFMKSRYHPNLRAPSMKDLLPFFYHVQDLGVESFSIKTSSRTEATIVLETKSKTRKGFFLEVDNNSPYLIKNLQEIQQNLSEILHQHP